jgi:hypothetical protein
MSSAPVRYPYRAVSELEDVIAAQHRVLQELRDLRRAATDLRTKQYLREQETRARGVHAWLTGLREEMHDRPSAARTEPKD